MNWKTSCAAFRAVMVAYLAVLGGCGGGGSDSGACSSIGTAKKIAGGDSCSNGQSNVAFIVAFSDTGFEECSGAYISTTAVLTAAHCVVSRPKDISIASAGYVRSGTSYQVHPLYDGRVGSPFDMAIIKVDRPITAGPLPVLFSTSPAQGDAVIAYGYGTDQNGREALLRIEAGEAALKATYLNYIGYRNGVVAVSSSGEGSPCPGDSGGPVVARNPNGDYGIVGITISGPQGCSAAPGRAIALASTQSQGAISFITSHVPDVSTN